MLFLGKVICIVFLDYFLNLDDVCLGEEKDFYGMICIWFGVGNKFDLFNDFSDVDYCKVLDGVVGLKKLVDVIVNNFNEDECYLYMELVVYGLVEFDILNKDIFELSLMFCDLFVNMFDEDDMFDGFNDN